MERDFVLISLPEQKLNLSLKLNLLIDVLLLFLYSREVVSYYPAVVSYNK